jgi:hypothetical protein
MCRTSHPPFGRYEAFVPTCSPSADWMNYRFFLVGCRIVPQSLRNRSRELRISASEDASGGGNPGDRHRERNRRQSSLGRWVARFAIEGKRENLGRKIQRSLPCGRHRRRTRNWHACGIFRAASLSLGCEEGSFVEVRDLNYDPNYLRLVGRSDDHLGELSRWTGCWSI